ncbi:MAG: hypothetical protein HY728_02410 [Candidatus Rokubacteria bacterium]|nr:hypothetical protein [Candidatus Rokubacteria bacterium]
MDPELVAYLDRRFSEFGQQLDRRFDVVDQRFDAVDQRLDAMDRRFDTVDRRFDAVDRRFDGVDKRFGEFDDRFTELRRHFDTVAESLMSKVELVGEGVRTVDQKVDRLGVEMRDECRRVDRRLLHLTARITVPRRRR